MNVTARHVAERLASLLNQGRETGVGVTQCQDTNDDDVLFWSVEWSDAGVCYGYDVVEDGGTWTIGEPYEKEPQQ